MPRRSDEDLFQESTMTFGEHLEELRSSLFKALLWLVGGFIAGLFFAPAVVEFIQSPLEKALTEHYKGAAIKQVTERLDELEEKGLPLPGKSEQLAELVAEQDLLPEEVFLQASEVLHEFEMVYSDTHRNRTEGLELLQSALPLLKRMQLPKTDPKRALRDDERDRVVEAIGLLDPDDFYTEDKEQILTPEDVEAMAAAVEDGEGLSLERAARVVKAVEWKSARFEKDLERITEGVDLMKRVRLPGLGPYGSLKRDDLIRTFVWKPIENDDRIRARALNAPEAFFIYIKAALLVGVMIASPGVFYHLWSFVAAGLYRHERKFVYFFGPFSLGLFVAGAALVFFFVFKVVLKFLFTFNEWLGIGIEPRITEWMGFVLILPLGFGIAFQLPLVMLFLHRIGVFSIQSYLAKWRVAILVIFVLSMLLTPADPGSMLMMAVPLTVLYFGGVLLCRAMPRRRRPSEESEDE
ncbi:MAG: twin-arginine translocase subunit TatC [Planctomycetota bacterium]|jgi:sec-independent protein translocase protein TatC